MHFPKDPAVLKSIENGHSMTIPVESRITGDALQYCLPIAATSQRTNGCIHSVHYRNVHEIGEKCQSCVFLLCNICSAFKSNNCHNQHYSVISGVSNQIDMEMKFFYNGYLFLFSSLSNPIKSIKSSAGYEEDIRSVNRDTLSSQFP